MINLEFIGRLGADAEVVKSKNGNEFITARVATDIYKANGEHETQWVRISYLGPRALKMKEWLTKGKLVQVRGSLAPLTTYNNKNGEVVVAVDVMADRVDFLPIGRSSENDTTTDSVDATKFSTDDEPVIATPAPKAKAAKTKAQVTTVTTAEVVEAVTPTILAANNDEEDDLPF